MTTLNSEVGGAPTRSRRADRSDRCGSVAAAKNAAWADRFSSAFAVGFFLFVRRALGGDRRCVCPTGARGVWRSGGDGGAAAANGDGDRWRLRDRCDPRRRTSARVLLVLSYALTSVPAIGGHLPAVERLEEEDERHALLAEAYSEDYRKDMQIADGCEIQVGQACRSVRRGAPADLRSPCTGRCR